MAKMSVPILVDWESIKDHLAKSDIVEVIRCKDCKFSSPNKVYGCTVYHFRKYETHEMKPDDFCSRAERKTE